MAVTLKTRAKEGSQYVISLTFKNSAGALAVPSAVRWTLTNCDREVINNRRHVVVAPAANIDVVLSGADLGVTEFGSTATRKFLVEAVDNGLPIVEEFTFKIEQSLIYPITTTTSTTI